MNRILFGVVVAVAALWAGGCASSSSSAAPLTIPEPPPRVAIAPAAVPEAPPAQRPAPRAPATTSQDSAETPSTEPTAVPSTVTVPPAASTNLRPSGSGAATTSSGRVREILARASQKLDALNRRHFSAGRQTDYDNARRFLLQAEAALKANNLMLAQSSAEKAEALADGLR